MIIRRIADAIRAQNWFTVFIEFTLVVAGVLVALQFDNWNKDRQDRVDETYYLGRILADIDESITNNEVSIAYLKHKAEATTWVVEKLRTGALPVDEEQVFQERFLEIGDWRSGDFLDSTVQELQSSGRVGIIRSKIFREHLGRFELKLESHRRAHDNIADFLKALELEVMARVDRDGKNTLLTPFDVLAKDVILIRYIERQAFFYNGRISNIHELQGYLLDLREYAVRALEGEAP